MKFIFLSLIIIFSSACVSSNNKSLPLPKEEVKIIPEAKTATVAKLEGLKITFPFDRQAKIIIRDNLSSINKCYDNGVKRNKRLSGKITVESTVIPGGKTKNTRVASSSLNDRRVEACIKNTINKLKFPDPGPKEAFLRFPFTFNTKENN